MFELEGHSDLITDTDIQGSLLVTARYVLAVMEKHTTVFVR